MSEQSQYIYISGKARDPRTIQVPGLIPPGSPENTFPVYNRGEDILFSIPRPQGAYKLRLSVRRSSFKDPVVFQSDIDLGPESEDPQIIKIVSTETAQLASDTYFYSLAAQFPDTQASLLRNEVIAEGLFVIQESPALTPLPPYPIVPLTAQEGNIVL